MELPSPEFPEVPGKWDWPDASPASAGDPQVAGLPFCVAWPVVLALLGPLPTTGCVTSSLGGLLGLRPFRCKAVVLHLDLLS